jgi:2-keto-3-deoxy-6-phosphogluconate aldolase
VNRRSETANQIVRSRALEILRLSTDSATVTAACALLVAETPVIEFSFTGADAADGLREVTRSGRAIVGAGTICRVKDDERAAGNGAQFPVAPTFNASLDEWATAVDVLYIPTR